MGSFTVALLEALVSAGVSPERARAVVDPFDRSVDERYPLHAQVPATKRNVAERETRPSREIVAIRVEIASTKVEIAGIEADIVEGFPCAMTARTALFLEAAKLH